ncbi:hypothetical protein ACWKSP_38455 [Micromonosporaceae bacterium Da 78-11]
MSDPMSPPEHPQLRTPSYSVPAQRSRPGQPPAEPPPGRRGPSMKLVLLLSVPVLLVAALCTGGLLFFAARKNQASALPAYVYTPGTAFASAQRRIDEREAAKAQVKATISAALTAQSAALLAGDKAKFVGFAARSAKRVAPWLTDRFTSLHAMGIARWDTTVVTFTPYTEPRWQANVELKYCFVADCARPLTATLHTMWDLADQSDPKLTEMWASDPGRATPPWAQSVLRARIGSRVVVAASSADAGRLPGALAAAEAAAKVADGYAGRARPGRYVVYLAGAKDWDTWPYGAEGKWVAAYANETTESTVVQIASLRTTDLAELLRHEMGHVASLAGRSTKVDYADSWWLTEGLAEHIGVKGRPFSSYSGRAETAAFVRNRWKGDLRVGAPTEKASVRDASARYGTAFLGVSCLMQKYGRARTLGFFHAVAVDGTGLSSAASQSLGVPWPTVTSTCVAQIRRTAK